MYSLDRSLSAFIIVAALASSVPAFGQSPCSGANSLLCTQWAPIDASMAQLIHQGYSLVSVSSTSEGHSNSTTRLYLSHGIDLVRCIDISTAMGESAAAGCQRLVEPYRVR